MIQHALRRPRLPLRIAASLIKKTRLRNCPIARLFQFSSAAPHRIDQAAKLWTYVPADHRLLLYISQLDSLYTPKLLEPLHGLSCEAPFLQGSHPLSELALPAWPLSDRSLTCLTLPTSVALPSSVTVRALPP